MIITVLGDSTTGNEVGLGLWTLSDANGDNLFVFNIGPSSGGEPQYERTFVAENELGSSSDVLSVVYEAADNIPTLEIRGTVLNLTQLEYLKFYAAREVPLLLTDDLARSFQVYATSLTADRKPHVSHPELHEYVMQFLVLDGLLDGDFWAPYVGA